MANRIAILVLAHCDPKLLHRLISKLRHPGSDVYVHIDRKATLEDGESFASALEGERCFLLPSAERVDVRWGDVSMVSAMIHLLRSAMKREASYSHFVFISGQHYPIRPIDDLVRHLSSHQNTSYIDLMRENDPLYRRFLTRTQLYWPRWLIGREPWKRVAGAAYRELGLRGVLQRKCDVLPINAFSFGSQWVTLNVEFANWLTSLIQNNKGVLEWFDHTCVPDECFFQTLFANSPFFEHVGKTLTYVDWSEGKASPKMLGIMDIGALEKAAGDGYYFARKFDSATCGDVLDYIDAHFLMP